jgi:alanine racemase
MDDHAAILTIDLAALAANWRLLAMRAGSAECGAVVKADAYGLGIEVAVPALAKAGCRTFFVAHLSEGIRARSVAPDAAIYILNGLAEARLADYRVHRLRPVLGSKAEIAFWATNGAGCETAALHIDTAMNRLGIRVEEARALVASQRLADLGIGLTMTHFSDAEVPGSKATAEQIAAFSALQSEIQGAGSLNQGVPASLSNSSGHFVVDAPKFQITRPGYALYGGNPTPSAPNPMQPVIRLEAPVIQVHTVPKGEPVGYNGNWIAARDSRIATISCGYADGFPRNAGNNPNHKGGSAIVAGVECPFAGNVSMDLITLDVTDLPAVKPGDFATLIGHGLDVDRVGASGKTTGYEILTSLGKRYRRVLKGS